MGAIAVAKGYPLLANVIWCGTNPYLIHHNYKHNHDIGQAIMFCVFWGIAIYGVYNLT